MSQAFTTVRSSLRELLLTVPGLPSVAWESRPFNPSVGTSYVRERLLPLGSPLTTLGVSGWVQEFFIYQLTLFSPFNESSLFEHEDLVGEIRDVFYPGLSIGGGIDVFAGMVVESSRGSVVTEPDWRSTSVDVEAYYHRSARVA